MKDSRVLHSSQFRSRASKLVVSIWEGEARGLGENNDEDGQGADVRRVHGQNKVGGQTRSHQLVLKRLCAKKQGELVLVACVSCGVTCLRSLKGRGFMRLAMRPNLEDTSICLRRPSRC